jgi:hypothetical protein
MNLELLFRIALTGFITVVWLIGLHWVWTAHLDPRATISRLIQKAVAPPEWVATREPNKIYQSGKAVGDVSGPVERKDRQVRFAQLSNTGDFDRGQHFEYQRLRLRVVRIDTAAGMKVEPSRTLTNVLEDVVCEIVQ